MALVDLVTSLGIAPRHVVGHSSGEMAAAYAAGALTREAACEAAYFRGPAASRLAARAPKLQGAMMVVGMAADETQRYLDTAGRSAQVTCVNSPRSTTVSGRAEAIACAERDLRARRVFCRVLDVPVAYHSSHMRLVEDEYRASLAGLSPRDAEPPVAMFSSVTERAVRGSELGPAY